VVFSVLSLLLDAKRTFETKRKTAIDDDSLTIRFSHPNWISEENVRALTCYRDAVAIAMNIFLEGIPCTVETGSVSILVEDLKIAVKRHYDIISKLPPFPPEYNYFKYSECSQGVIKGASWQLVFESSAAGFPYLVEGERETFEGELTEFRAGRRIRTILVVDVGAGSTDAGYMVRTVRPKNLKGVMRPLLISLPTGDALEVAGRWLTDKILADLKQQGRRVTPVEAEDYKISSNSWYQKPYVHEWTALIGEHISDYVHEICDEVCLPRGPGLELVLTGGSSVVEPLRKEIVRQVTSALARRRTEGLSHGNVIEVRSATTGYRAVEVAQLAVALGASDPLLAEMTAHPEGLRQVGPA
jgi:hypothetical protein